MTIDQDRRISAAFTFGIIPWRLYVIYIHIKMCQQIEIMEICQRTLSSYNALKTLPLESRELFQFSLSRASRNLHAVGYSADRPVVLPRYE